MYVYDTIFCSFSTDNIPFVLYVPGQSVATDTGTVSCDRPSILQSLRCDGRQEVIGRDQG